MSKEAAREFIDACQTDDKIANAVRSHPAEEGDSPEALVSIAAGFGYEFTALELGQAFVEKNAESRAALEGQELSEEEMAQISGGGKWAGCSSDYDPSGWCWFDDRCTKAWNFYGHHPDCSSTYLDTLEDCSIDDHCQTLANTYF